jgi:hypothetical protein
LAGAATTCSTAVPGSSTSCSGAMGTTCCTTRTA